MKLLERQQLFAVCIAKLILFIESKGYKCTTGDFQAKLRSPLEHKKTSLHYERCAGDLNLYLNGVWLTKTEDHKLFGAYWETLHPLCLWGGRGGDGNHYAVSPDGVKW